MPLSELLNPTFKDDEKREMNRSMYPKKNLAVYFLGA